MPRLCVPLQIRYKIVTEIKGIKSRYAILVYKLSTGEASCIAVVVDSLGFADIITIGSAIAPDIIFIDVKYCMPFIIQMLHIASIIIKTVTISMVNQIV